MATKTKKSVAVKVTKRRKYTKRKSKGAVSTQTLSVRSVYEGAFRAGFIAGSLGL